MNKKPAGVPLSPELLEPPPMELPPISAYEGYEPEGEEDWQLDPELPGEVSPGGHGGQDAPAPRPHGRPIVASRSPSELMREVFGFDSFRPLQAEVIQSVLSLRDTLAVMPTGGGKSLCYQLPALLFDGLTVVVSPLISLMQDQVQQLEATGVAAVVLNSALDPRSYRRNQALVRSGQARLLYLAPETLLQERTLSLLDGLPVSCLTIDEAHCISEWGHDFRPEYRQIVEVRARFPQAVCLGLTATATPRVRDDIAQSLRLTDEGRFVASFDRPNLILRVAEKDRPFEQVEAFIERVEGDSGIVYCSTRKTVEQVTERLVARGYRARAYHAGLDMAARHEHQRLFIHDDIDVIVATVAFGMGIDKPDVRFVVHYDLPKNLESYYQQVGRAGRDGLPSECLLLYGPGDLHTIGFFISQKPDAEQRIARLQLSRMQAFAETTLCRRRPLLGYFDESYDEPSCGACDNCLDPRPELVDLTVQAQKLLSCAYRTGQRYGLTHLVEVLRGSTNKKVLAAGHDRVSTYGLGRDLSAAQWRHIGRQLVQRGLLLQDAEYGGLTLTAAARPVLQGVEPFEGRLIRPARSKPKRASRSRARAELPTAYDRGLFELLRAQRKALASAENIAPYMVFADRTLIEMAAALPRTEADLAEIHGVGRVKLSHYGPHFLEVIARWCDARGDAPAPARAPELPPAEPAAGASSGRRERVARALVEGLSLQAIAAAEKIKDRTVIQHLDRWLEGGGALPVQPLRALSALPDELVERALRAFEAHGPAMLRPVHDALDGRVDYVELERIRLLYRVGWSPASAG